MNLRFQKKMFSAGLMTLLMSVAFCVCYSNRVMADDDAALKGSPCGEQEKSWVSRTHQKLLADGQAYSYEVTAGYINVKLEVNQARGCVFFTYYQMESKNKSQALTFAFNGGPGASSDWVHLGGLGPQRVNMGADGLSPIKPYRLQNNNDSLLPLSDLVFIDPVGTGFSHADEGSTNDQFYGVSNDALSVAVFVENFLDTFNRRDSKIYVLGESYGGVRAPLVARHLQEDHLIALSGLILISPQLSSAMTAFVPNASFDASGAVETGTGDNDNVEIFAAYLPSYAVAAWYHHKSSEPFRSFKDEATVYKKAKAFALGRYRAALELGDELPNEEFHAVAAIVSQWLGISQTVIESWNLRIKDDQFITELLAEEGLTVGVYDSRFKSVTLADQHGTTVTDPSALAPSFATANAINAYLRHELGFKTNLPYVVQANITKWSTGVDGGVFSVTHDLSQAIADATVIAPNALLPVFVGSGYYDLSCPVGAVEYELARVDRRVTHAIEIHRYQAGHPLYMNPTALVAFKNDLRPFYHPKSSIPQNNELFERIDFY